LLTVELKVGERGVSGGREGVHNGRGVLNGRCFIGVFYGDPLTGPCWELQNRQVNTFFTKAFDVIELLYFSSNFNLSLSGLVTSETKTLGAKVERQTGQCLRFYMLFLKGNISDHRISKRAETLHKCSEGL